jgi:hypothetical protein
MSFSPRSRCTSWRSCLGRSRVVVLMCLVLGCEAPAVMPPEERQEGDGCGDALSECIDADSLWRCRERTWEFLDCAEECEELGGAIGCLASAVAADGARCWCRSTMPECVPGRSKCGDDDEIVVCQRESLRFGTFECADLCGDLEPPQVSRGCQASSDGADCRCTREGTPCSSATVAHCEDGRLASCVDGTWRLAWCDGECAGSATCDPWATGGATCVCTDD